MTEETIVAPSLSTYQDDTAFSFDKVKAKRIDRKHLGEYQNQEELIKRIWQYYSLSDLITFLGQTTNGKINHKRITLQFPDSLICDSAIIVHELQRELSLKPCLNTADKSGCDDSTGCCGKNNIETDEDKQRLWILADTSYSTCCIDEVAAEHVHSDLVVHFGDACLNDVEKLAAAYVFGKPEVDIHSVVSSFKQRYEDVNSPIILMADAPHTYILHSLYQELQSEYTQLIIADLHINENSQAEMIGYQPRSTSTDFHKFNRSFINYNLDISFDSCDLFHITTPEAPRLLQLTTNFSSVTIYDTATNTISQGPFPNLMRRYKYMHVARSAGTIGLLVNTLSLTNTKKLINVIGARIKAAGKKHYVFVVGKPNVAKLANFETVDLWCVVGCDHSGIVLDQTGEYFRPIVTPYELLLALSDEMSWTGKWITDYASVLENYKDSEEQVEEEQNEDDEDAPPEFDPVTGRYVSTSRPLRQINHLMISSEEENKEDETENSLVKKFASTIAIRNTVSTSAAQLQNRAWTGLGSDFTDEQDNSGTLVEEGTGGIARGIFARKSIIPYYFLLCTVLLIILSNWFKNYNLPSNWNRLNENDIALITGGSNGLGLAIVKKLLAKNVTVYVLDASTIRIAHEKLVFVKCDVGNEDMLILELQRIIRDLNQSNRHISVLINNAGIRDNLSLLNIKEIKIRIMVNVNFMAPIWILREVVSNHVEHVLSKNSEAELYVVTVSSILGTLAPKNLSLYSATKAALISLHEAMTQELKEYQGIRLLLVTTGQLSTAMFQDVEPSRLFFAPIVNHVELAKDIVTNIDIGYSGNITNG
ncbi:Diphthamide biosynthesis protein 2 [Spathaspora sp. JA1]|nr:Diphthamide biosynthesis protein 2 [Spathaspora sp. JA1]